MKIKHLIKNLKKYNQDSEVLIADNRLIEKYSDENGNTKGFYKNFNVDDEHFANNIILISFDSSCSKDNPEKMCNKCNCWKKTRILST